MTVMSLSYTDNPSLSTAVDITGVLLYQRGNASRKANYIL